MDAAKKVDHSSHVEHENRKNVQKGVERLERHSGTGRSGEVKKGGAGGKHTWGSLKDEMDTEPPPAVLDDHDPNYDPDEENKKADT